MECFDSQGKKTGDKRRGGQSRRGPPLKKKNLPIEEEVIDVNLYEMENILCHKFEGNRLLYLIKWKDFDETENSWEHEKRVISPDLLLKYAISLWGNRKNDEIDDIMEDIDNISHEDLVILSIFALSFYDFGCIQYIYEDSISWKKSLLKAVSYHDQSWILKTVHGCSLEDMSNDMKRYKYELDYRIQCSRGYPTINVFLNLESKLDNFIQPPPPQCNLVFDTIRPTRLQGRSKNNIVIKKSSNVAFENIQIFGHQDFFKYQDDPNRDLRFKKDPIGSNKYKIQFTANFTLYRPHHELGWVLCANSTINRGTPLLKMGGSICPANSAHNSYLEEGLIVAFSSFLKLGDSGFCLDRRRYYDFSRFIKHDCVPNCVARLVENKAGIREVIVYSNNVIAKYSDEVLTLDYYEAFIKEVDDYFGKINDPLVDKTDGRMHYLLKKNIDFVLCSCRSLSCRKVLYIGKANSVRKRKNSSDTGFTFLGMPILNEGDNENFVTS